MYKYTRLPDPVDLRQLAKAVHQAIRGEVRVDEAEAQLVGYMRDLFGFSRFILTGNGRQALGWALSLTDPAKKEVITPAYGCSIIPLTIKAVGKQPVFVDVDERTFAISPSSVKQALGPNTAAVIIVHEFGNPVNRTFVQELRQEFNGIIVEDAAIAFASQYGDGTLVGQEGDFTIFSGSLGKPVSGAAWGGLGVHPRVEFDEIALNRARASSIGTLLKVLALLIIRQRCVFNVMRPLIDRSVNEDAVKVDTSFVLPSYLDNFLIMEAIQCIDDISDQVYDNGMKLVSMLKQHSFRTLDVRGRPLFSRIPFYAENVQKRDIFIKTFRRAGIELQRPYQHNFARASRLCFPNAYKAVEQVVCVSVKRAQSQNFEKCFAQALEQCL